MTTESNALSAAMRDINAINLILTRAGYPALVVHPGDFIIPPVLNKYIRIALGNPPGAPPFVKYTDVVGDGSVSARVKLYVDKNPKLPENVKWYDVGENLPEAGWYFRDETDSLNGPYAKMEHAKAALDKYCEGMG